MDVITLHQKNLNGYIYTSYSSLPYKIRMFEEFRNTMYKDLE